MLGLEEVWIDGRKRKYHEQKSRGNNNLDIIPTPSRDDMHIMPAISGVDQPSVTHRMPMQSSEIASGVLGNGYRVVSVKDAAHGSLLLVDSQPCVIFDQSNLIDISHGCGGGTVEISTWATCAYPCSGTMVEPSFQEKTSRAVSRTIHRKVSVELLVTRRTSSPDPQLDLVRISPSRAEY